jgi:hypothetical protein
MRFSIKSKFFAAACVKHKRREKCDYDSNIDGIEHNHFQTGGGRAPERDNATIFIWVNLRLRTSRPRGSPFQLPARLAVGLGLESGLETGCPASFAPSSNHFEEFGSPAPGFRKEARLRLQQWK